MTVITESLFMGPPEAAVGSAQLLPVESASDALTVIKSGFQALLPPGSWAMAADVLMKLGAELGDVAWLFEVAQRGQSS